MLAGRYPSDEFAELRPRLVWDRVTGELHRPAGRAAARGDQRRHDPRPRPVRRLPRRRRGRARPPGRRAGRGDGLRVAGRRRVPARLVVLADRGHHPRPGAGHAGARASSGRCRSGRATRRAGRSSWAGRWARSCARCRRRRPTKAAAPGPGRRARRVGHRQPAGLPGRAEARPPGTCRTTARCWSSGSATSSATGGWSCTRRSGRRSTRRGRWRSPRRLRERYGVDVQSMHSDDGIVLRLPDDRRRAARGRARAVRAGRDRGAGHRRGRRLGAVRVPVPGVRGPGAAAAAARPAPAHAAVAAAAAGRAPAPGRQRVRLVPDRAGGDAGVPAGRLRRARAGRADARPRGRGRCGSSRSRRRSRRRSRGRCCSATSACSCTRATRRWPSGGRRRCRWTPRCWPSCSGRPSCASCSTPTRSPRSSASCSGWPRTGGARGRRGAPTCCGCSAT